VQEKEKRWRDIDVETRTEKTGIGRKERKEGAECAMRRETIEHIWNGCREMKERERKERGEILKGKGRHRMDERDMEKEAHNGKRDGWRIETKKFFLGIVIFSTY
jgi:hypothetical protein